MHNLNYRALIAVAHDMFWAMLIWIAGFALRYGAQGLDAIPSIAFETLPVVLGIQFATFIAFGLYQGMWRYASWHDLRRIFGAVMLSGLLVASALMLWRRGEGVPRSLMVLNPLLLMLFMAWGRIAYRWWKVERPLVSQRDQADPVLLLTYGEAHLGLIYEIERSPRHKLLGILSEDPRTRGRSIAGVPVVGRWNDLRAVALRLGVNRVILSDQGLNQAARIQAINLCAQMHLKLMILPGVDDVVSGRIQFSPIRDIEVDDLLGREPVQLETEKLGNLLGDQIVLVTGAGGSIGSELCRQIARFNPGLLVLLELNEYALYNIEQEFAQRFPSVRIACIIGDVKDAQRVEEVFDRYGPSVVFHAAAYKHVPLMETENAWEAVRNNTYGTLVLMRAIDRHPVKKFVYVSTDKAVNPTSVMGATKRLSEMLLQHWNLRVDSHTVIVRFGNVLGSTGSVVPKFQEQIAQGGPVTVTHPEMRRYFMSVAEATQLVLQAALMGEGGEIFVLDMGKPVRIVDLAREMIRLSGFSDEEIRVEFTGLRPGEKLFEELLANDETTMPTRHRKLRISKVGRLPGSRWEARVRQWLGQSEPLTSNEVRAQLRQFVHEYNPNVPLATENESNVVALPLVAQAVVSAKPL